MTGRLVLLMASPRVAPGLLSRSAWEALETADAVLARDDEEPLAEAVREAGMPVSPAGAEPPPTLARRLVDEAGRGQVVWLGSADGDVGLSDAIASEVTRLDQPPEVEVLVGSWDPPGSRLLDVVAVMDRLRSPGGCPWDAEQTHGSLVRYLIEEAHEAAEAIESGDRTHMAEELGDLLLQVLFQARVAQDDPAAPFDIDDVAGALVEKLVRRHPHVFADGDASTADEVETAWEQIKATEDQASRADGEPADPRLAAGIPASLPSLVRAEKVLDRWQRRGGDPGLLSSDSKDLGEQLLALVVQARAAGLSADTELRAALQRLDDG